MVILTNRVMIAERVETDNGSGSTPVQIVKRDGRKVRFEPRRIEEAIFKAGQATNEFEQAISLRLADHVVEALIERTADGSTPRVEAIQDIVEETLMARGYFKTARAYILYRERHAQLRDKVQEEHVQIIREYLDDLDWSVRENCNMTFSLQGLNHYVSSKLSRAFWMYEVYGRDVRQAHEGGDIHVHDTNLVSSYCVGWDLYQLLQEGFRGVPGKTAASPARHFRAALGQVVNFLYTMQGEAAGAQAFSNVDTLLAPFIRYDGLTYKEVRQCMQAFIFNMNTPTRVGFQSPFTNITLDLTVPRHYAEQPVVIGGEFQPECYGEFQQEMDMFNRAFFEIMEEGDAEGRLFSFPIPTLNLTKRFDWENPNLEPMWRMTGKYGIPYFSNFINSDMSEEDARSMCCRLRIDNTQLAMKGGGLFGAHPLTGSIGVVTINLPRIAFLSQSKTDFLERLNYLMDIAKDSLEKKRVLIEDLTSKGLFPYTRHYLRHIHERFGKYWANHFSTIGLVGMNEACTNFLDVGLGTEEGQVFSAEILDHMRQRLVDYQKETGHNYNLEATPAEGTSYRLALLDTEQYPGIQVANTEGFADGDEPYYSNSSHLPVGFTDDPFEALEYQDALQTRYTGGTVLHLFLGEQITDPSSVRQFVRRVAENYRLPYFSLTPTFSICRDHGYLPGEHFECPSCGKSCEVYSRIVGYLRPVRQWHDGKQAEFKDRLTYKVDACGCDHGTTAQP